MLLTNSGFGHLCDTPGNSDCYRNNGNKHGCDRSALDSVSACKELESVYSSDVITSLI